MRKHILDHWLDNLDSFFTTYAAVAKMSGTLLEQTHRSHNDALHLFFELSNRQLGQFWSWYYPDAPDTINPSARNPTGIALAIGLDDEALATLRPILAHEGQRLVIIEPGTGHRPASVDSDFDPDHLQCDIHSDKACDKLITRLEKEIGPVELLIKRSTARPVRGIRSKGVLDKELDCIYNLTRHLIPGMISRGHGRIIILKPESEADERSRYAGITSFIHSLARELSQFGITVECLAAAAAADTETLVSANGDKIAKPLEDRLPYALDMPGQALTL